jgi:molybdopterin synthase sulfur carrier subunit
MKINLLYFASLKEKLGCGKEQLELSDEIKTVEDLKVLLSQRGASWSESFKSDHSLLVSINQQMANELSNIKNDDEVAFFPPVTGG